MKFQSLCSSSLCVSLFFVGVGYSQGKDVALMQQQVNSLSKKLDVLDDTVKSNPAFNHVPAAGPESMPATGIVIVNDDSFKVTIGGFARLDFLYTPDQIGDVDQFVTATIPVEDSAGNKKINGADYTPALRQYHFNAKRSRLFVKAERPFGDVNLKAYIEGDFWGTGHFRLRHAYGEFNDISIGRGKGALLVGQTYSAFTVNEAQPSVLDNQGPNGAGADRYPVITWRHQVLDWFMYKLSIEQSQYDSTLSEVNVSGIVNPVAVDKYESTYPMLVAAAIFGTVQRNIQFSVAYSHIEADLDLEGVGHVTDRVIDGYAFNVGGKLAFGESNFVRYYAAYSRGLGLLIPDLETGFSDGVFGTNAAESKILYLDSFGTLLALEHYWTPKWSSNLVWSYVDVDNTAGQAGYAYKNSNYIAANVIWKPVKQLMFGAEYLWGDRENKDGSEGDASRVQLSAQFLF